ncbi:MAG: proline dehydrogenase family protein [Rhodococcus sp. (in: high G+C Gram-positive bacteria)]
MTTVRSNPLRPALLAAARSPRIEATMSKLPITRQLVERFVAGETEPEVVSAVADLLGSGRFVSVDYLGEDTTDAAQATATVDAYLSLLRAYSALDGAHRSLEVSVKLSALGQGIDRSLAIENARTICAAADGAGVWVTVDAEDHTTTDSTLSIVRELRREFPDLGTVLQAYLKRTEEDCRSLSGHRSRIRLCKGAYNEPESVAFQKPADVSDSYVRCLAVLMEGQGYPMVATHDPQMIDAAGGLAKTTGRTPDSYEFQMLYGIRDAEQRRLVGAGNTVRVYVPYGDQWYRYFMRRLAERPANLMFFLRSLVSRH